MSRVLLFVVSILATTAHLSAAQWPGDQPPVPQQPGAIPVPIPPDQPRPAQGTPPPQPPRQVTPAPAPTPGAVPPVILTPPEPPRRTRGRDMNIQIELTITDQMGAAAPDKKTISMMTAEATMGRVRATGDSIKGPTSLNVDARPTALENDRILLELTVEFAPLRESQVSQRPTVLNESITVILTNGKPLVVSQAADPISDRKMTLEVKATIVK
jgi:hypothetical protein